MKKINYAAATIKFVDCNFTTGTVTLMVGNRIKDICSWQWDVLKRKAQEWNSGLITVSAPYQSTVMMFSVRRAQRVDGLLSASWVMRCLDIR